MLLLVPALQWCRTPPPPHSEAHPLDQHKYRAPSQALPQRWCCGTPCNALPLSTATVQPGTQSASVTCTQPDTSTVAATSQYNALALNTHPVCATATRTAHAGQQHCTDAVHTHPGPGSAPATHTPPLPEQAMCIPIVQAVRKHPGGLLRVTPALRWHWQTPTGTAPRSNKWYPVTPTVLALHTLRSCPAALA
jgi:hypothetical protein